MLRYIKMLLNGKWPACTACSAFLVSLTTQSTLHCKSPFSWSPTHSYTAGSIYLVGVWTIHTCTDLADSWIWRSASWSTTLQRAAFGGWGLNRQPSSHWMSALPAESDTLSASDPLAVNLTHGWTSQCLWPLLKEFFLNFNWAPNVPLCYGDVVHGGHVRLLVAFFTFFLWNWPSNIAAALVFFPSRFTCLVWITTPCPLLVAVVLSLKPHKL